MILVTVGSAPHPFTRLVEAVDKLSENCGCEVIIQYGFTSAVLKYAKGFDFVPYEEMLQLYQRADLVISHASAGPILFAERFHKPLILFPRSGDLGEHLDNHQTDFATALQREDSGLEIVFNGDELEATFHKVRATPARNFVGAHSRENVKEEIQKYLESLKQDKSEHSRNSVWRKIKELLYYLRVYRFLSSLWNQTFWVLRRGYQPKNFWNLWSGHYVKEKARGVIGASHEWLFDKIRQYSEGKILEVGCGYGRTLDFLRNKAEKPLSLWGVDISMSMLIHACKQLPAEIASRLVCSDFNFLPFADQSFDLVFTRGALMHCPENSLEKSLSELERVSKGEMILVEEAFWDSHSHNGQTFSLNDYTFIHDYSALLVRKGWAIVEKKLVSEGMVVLIYLVCRKAAREGESVPAQKLKLGK